MSDSKNGQYHFFSWLRRGMSLMIPTVDSDANPAPIRPVLDVNLTVTAYKGGSVATQQNAKMSVNLHGPGDVSGLDTRHVLQTEPLDLTANFEPNYFCGIEFSDPDLPWLFTPAAPDTANNRLRPWLCLIVLKNNEYKQASSNTSPIDVTDLDALPDLSESWAWSHTQITGDIPASGVSSLLTDTPHVVISRILCPRKLDPDTAYSAFLVPAFEAGRLALLGQDTSGVQTATPAWPPADGKTPLTLPFFTQFQFHTSDQGDFESLVRRLNRVVLPPEVGIRPMDVSQPGAGLPPASATPLALGGALRSLDTQDTSWADPQKTTFQNEVKKRINQTAALIDDPNAPAAKDPVVVPPMYGRWHSGVTAVDQNTPGWVNDLNLDPRTRSMAGFGTRVVSSQRVQLMASAWRQVQGIKEANQQLRQGQMARTAMVHLFAKNFKSASDEVMLGITHSVHKRLAASPRTVAATIAASRLPSRSLSPAFRRITAPRGILRQRQGGSAPDPASIVARLNIGDISPVPDYQAPDGMVSLDDVSQQLASALIPSWVPSWLHWIWPYILKVLLVVLILLVAAAVLVAIFIGAGAAAAIAVAAAAVLAAYLTLRSSFTGQTIAQQLKFANLTATRIANTPPQPTFQISAIGATPAPIMGGAGSGPTDSADAVAFRAAASTMLTRAHRFSPAAPPRPPLTTSTVRATVQARLDPTVTVVGRMKALVNLGAGLTWSPADPIAPIMAYPVFDQPMYEPLRDMSQDFLLPGLAAVPPDTLGLLQTNEVFIEAYMVGMNVAMERELLWEEYPCDQRGSPFRQFWDVRSYVPTATDPTDPGKLKEMLRDVPAIHTWPANNSLGNNSNRPDVKQGNLVLLIRGELLRRYPKAVIYVCEAAWNGEGHKRKLTTNERYPLFRGTLEPDVTFFGFALDENTARGGERAKGEAAGWFFVFQPPPSGSRFGLEPVQTVHLQTWDQLSWADFKFAARADGSIFAQASVNPSQSPSGHSYMWGKDSAQTAHITFRPQKRIAVHASLMLPRKGVN
jgi:hypothetical protein